MDQIAKDLIVNVYEDLEAQGRDMLMQAGVSTDLIRNERSADMRYIGQGHEINVGLPTESPADNFINDLEENFYEAYGKLYGHAHRDVPIEILTCRVIVTGPKPTVNLERFPPEKESVKVARKGEREAFFLEADGYVSAAVYDRYTLRSGATFSGPAIIEERESTVVVPPGMIVTIDEYQNLIMQLEK